MNIYDRLKVDPACHTPLTPMRFLERARRYYGNRVGVISDERQYTWAEISSRCARLASALKLRGVVRGDTVSVLAPNGIAIFEAHFGVPLCGAVLNNINTRLEVSTVTYILEHCEAKVLLVDTEFGALAKAAVQNLKNPPMIVDIVDPSSKISERIGLLDYETLLEEGDEQLCACEPLDELQPISLSYTSGTTGLPKGVVYDHRNAFVQSVGNMLSWEVHGEVTALWAVPIFHANGWCYIWPFTGIGSTNVLLRRPSGKAVLDNIAKYKCTHVLGAPIVAQMMSEVDSSERPKFTHDVKMLTAGSPPSPSHFLTLEELGIQLDQGYGLSEVWGPAIFQTPDPSWERLAPEERARIKARQGIPNMVLDDVVVATPSTGLPVPWDGQTLGEVLFKGNVVMRGYLKDPKATAEAFTNGFFHSGDLAVCHPDGTIELRDRSKDIIISGGENISSVEVEQAIAEHPSVASAAVIGVPDPKWGEVPWAFVEVKPGLDLTVDAVLAHSRDRLVGFKVPKGVSFGIIPRTATGKIQKFILRKLFEGKTYE